MTILPAQLDLDRSGISVVELHGVARQVLQDLGEQIGVAADPDVGRDVRPHREMRRQLADVFEHLLGFFAQVDGVHASPHLAGVGLREQQELADDRAQPLHLGEEISIVPLLGRSVRRLLQDLLQLSLQNGQRRLELVRGVGAEARGLAKAPLQALQHAVHDLDELRELAVGADGRDALVQAPRVDPGRGAGDHPDRPQSARRQPPAASGQKRESERAGHQEKVAIAVVVGEERGQIHAEDDRIPLVPHDADPPGGRPVPDRRESGLARAGRARSPLFRRSTRRTVQRRGRRMAEGRRRTGRRRRRWAPARLRLGEDFSEVRQAPVVQRRRPPRGLIQDLPVLIQQPQNEPLLSLSINEMQRTFEITAYVPARPAPQLALTERADLAIDPLEADAIDQSQEKPSERQQDAPRNQRREESDLEPEGAGAHLVYPDNRP